jgi:FAD/FMN-containing dehydrogenase
MSDPWAALRDTIDGEVVPAGTARYDDVRKPAIARFHDSRPRAVVLCASPSDVSRTIAYAHEAGLPIAVRSGGHCFAGRSSSEGIVIDVTPMNSVTVSNRIVQVGAGARLGGIYDTLARHGLTIPAGCGPTVGISGLTLGGGLGILGRTYGLTCDHLQAAQVVLADGRIVDCDGDREPDLFWALRGGGSGNLGVVTSLVFDTVPAPDATSFHLTWAPHHAVAVVAAWQSWAPDGPDGLAASLLLSAAADAHRPPVISLFGAFLGGEPECAALLTELTQHVGAVPTSVAYRSATYREVKHHLADLDVHGLGKQDDHLADGHSYSKSEFFAQNLPGETVAALVEHLTIGRVHGEARELDFSPWRGAYNRVAPDATAFVHRAERFLLKQSVVVAARASDARKAAARQWLATSWHLAHPWGTGGVYPNFPDPDLDDPGAAYFGSNYKRLRRVEQTYDPDGFFRQDRWAERSSGSAIR